MAHARSAIIAAAGMPPPAAIAGFALIYVFLGALSLSTAYIQPNAAAVWIPSGYATGLLIARGRGFWPAILAGSFTVNAMVNFTNPDGMALDLLAALAVAVGNTAEAVLAAFLTERFADGKGFLNSARSVRYFLLLTVPLPPLVSAGVGLLASHLAALPAKDSEFEVFVTWYVANAAGMLIFCGIIVGLLEGGFFRFVRHRLGELLLLAGCLIFASQALCGVYFSEAVAEWTKPYMVIPLLLWAALRFGASGGLAAIALITVGASVGAMRGFQVFPADSPWQALTFLQIFLAMQAVMILFMTAAVAEATSARAELELRVRARTREVEQLLRRGEVFAALVAHDLKSPVYGIRNTLRTCVSGLAGRRLSTEDLLPALQVIEETCTALGDRVESLLSAPYLPEEAPGAPLATVMDNIAAAHRLTLQRRRVRLETHIPARLIVPRAREVEHIVDTLIDNAVRFSQEGDVVTVSASLDSGGIRITVADLGPGLPPDRLELLVRRDRPPAPPGESGQRPRLGLYLAAEQARWMDGALLYEPNWPTGARFVLHLPYRHVAFGADPSDAV